MATHAVEANTSGHTPGARKATDTRIAPAVLLYPYLVSRSHRLPAANIAVPNFIEVRNRTFVEVKRILLEDREPTPGIAGEYFTTNYPAQTRRQPAGRVGSANLMVGKSLS